jgi:hypothetical protein
VNSPTSESGSAEIKAKSGSKNLSRFKITAAVFSVLGLALFIYFVATIGVDEILSGVGRIGFGGFALILFIHFLRLTTRATAWRLSVYSPYELSLKDTVPAVVMGEALSTMIPLGILVSGTAKAVAVRRRVPLVVGLSSVATENLFYSLVTGIFIALGGFAFLRIFELPDFWRYTIDLIIFGIVASTAFGFLMVLRQWHFASEICESLYRRGWLGKYLEHGRLQVRLFENLIYGFYRQYPKRFAPIVGLEILFHTLGVAEVLFIVSRIAGSPPTALTAFLLESMSRTITTTFKLVPFVIGIDEAGAQFVTETLAIGAAVGVTLAIVRKGKSLFWAIIGVILIVSRGLSLRELRDPRHANPDDR